MQVQEVQVLSRWHITVCNYNFRISAWILNATRCRDVGRGRSVNLPISARGPYYAHHLGQWTLTLPTTLLFAPPPPSDFWTVPQWLFGLKNNSFQYWSTPRGPRGVKKSHFFSQMKVFSFCAKIACKRHKLKKPIKIEEKMSKKPLFS